MKTLKYLTKINLEAYIWIAAIALLAIMNPEAQHFSLCPLKNLGFEHCPGCGLGHSIAFIFHAQFLESLKAHPLGGPALLMLLFRIVYLIQLSIKNQKTNINYE